MELLEIPLVGDTKESQLPTPEEYTYWKDRKNRTFYVDYEIDECYSLVELAKIIIQMNIEERDVRKEDLKPIRLFIHSYGGDLEQANFFCDLVQASRIPIITIAMGVAMSAGFLIFLSGHKRYAFKHTQLMVHSGSAAFQGTAEQIEESENHVKYFFKKLRRKYGDVSFLGVRELQKRGAIHYHFLIVVLLLFFLFVSNDRRTRL